MSESSDAPAATSDRHRKRVLLRTWLTLTMGIGIATFLFYRFFRAGRFPPDSCSGSGCTLGPALSAVTSVVFAAGVALLIAILLQNWGRYRQVFRPNRARLVGAAALAALAPLIVFSGVPWILLPTLIFVAVLPFLGGRDLGGMEIASMAATPLVAIALAYPISCLLVSGLRRKFVRFGGFTLVWWSAYCLVLMHFGL